MSVPRIGALVFAFIVVAGPISGVVGIAPADSSAPNPSSGSHGGPSANQFSADTAIVGVQLNVTANRTTAISGAAIQFNVRRDDTGNLTSANLIIDGPSAMRSVSTGTDGTAAGKFDARGRYTVTASKPDASGIDFLNDSITINILGPEFTYSNLSVTPSSIKTGESVNVSATVTNTGNISGSFTATLMLNGTAIAGKNGTLASGENTTVSFTLAPTTAGEHSITIDGLPPQTVTVEPKEENGGFNNLTTQGLSASTVNATSGKSVELNRTFGGIALDLAKSLVTTADSGLVFAGSTESFEGLSADAWIVKIGPDETVELNRTFGGNERDVAESVVQTADNGLAFTGWTISFGSVGADAWLVKLAPNGTVELNRTFGGARLGRVNHDQANSLVETADGGLAFAGETSTFSVTAFDDAWVVKVGPNGSVELNRTFGGVNHDIANSIIETADGGLAFAGMTQSFGGTDSDAWIVKLGPNGTVLINRTFGGNDRDVANSLVETADGGLAFAGKSESFGSWEGDAWIVKLGPNGTVLINRTFGGNDRDVANSLVETADGGFAFSGTTESYGDWKGDAWMVKIGTNDTVEMNRTFGGGELEKARSVVETADQGLAFAGRTESFGSGGSDAWVVEVADISSGKTRSQNWPMFGANPARTGHADTVGPVINISERWNFTTGTAVFSSPAVVNGTVYFGGTDNKTYALNAKTGTERWNFSTGDDVVSSPAVVNRTVYIGSYDNNVYALDAKTGVERWNFLTGDIVPSSPVVVNGTVYVASFDNKTYALDAQTGIEHWNFSTGDSVPSSPAVVNGTVYVGSYDNKVYALDAQTGTERWNFTTGDVIDASPAVINGTVYIGSADNKTYALDAQKGTERWNFTTGDRVWSSPAVVNGTVYIGSWDNKVYALDAQTGTERWNFSTGDDVYSSPAVVNGTVYIGSYDNKVYALDAKSGVERWNFSTGGIVFSSPVVVKDTLYIGSYDNKMYALSSPTSTATANITYSNLYVSPTSVSTGESINVTATVTNTGSATGSFNATLVVNGPLVAVRSGTLASGEKTTVSFNYTFATAGIYSVTIDGLAPQTVKVLAPPTAPAPAPEPVSPPAWPIFGANPARTGHIDTVGPTRNVTERWNFTTGAGVFSSPAVFNSTIYIGSNDNNVYALDAQTGAELWNFTTGNDVRSSPAVANGTVYVGSFDHKVYALDAQTGDELWNFTTRNKVFPSPLVANGTVYVGDNENKVYALDAQTGEELWNFTTGAGVDSSPAVSNGTVYIGSEDNKLYALDAQTGNERWNFTTGANVFSSPAVANGTVFVGSQDKIVYALDAQTGAEHWNMTTGAEIWSSPAVFNGTVYIGVNDDKLYALDAETGIKSWTFKTKFRLTSSPTVVNGVVYIGSRDDKVYALDAQTGAELWNFTTGNQVFSSPAVVNGTVYIGSYDTKVYALTGQTSVPTANISYSNLSVSPISVTTGESINVTATVTNTGSASGSFNATLVVNGTLVGVKSGTLPSGAKTTVTHTLSFSTTGVRSITVDGLSPQIVNVEGPPVVCPGCGVPTDPDGDGRLEDLNGNGGFDFNDIVVLFNHLFDPAVTDHVSAYDFNGNGRIDFDDIVTLFEEI